MSAPRAGGLIPPDADGRMLRDGRTDAGARGRRGRSSLVAKLSFGEVRDQAELGHEIKTAGLLVVLDLPSSHFLRAAAALRESA